LKQNLTKNQIGVFLETAHPAKFTETVEDIIGKGNVPLPEKLADFMKGDKKSRLLKNEYNVFKNYLLEEVVLK
jgi:threonine synthase